MNSFKENFLRNQLDRGEKLIWSSESIPSPFKGGSMFIAIFGCFFFLFSLFWIFSAMSIGGGAPGAFSFFPFFGIPFTLVGLGLMSAPAINYKSMKNTIYGITDKRCIIIKGFKNLKVQSYPLNSIGEISKLQRPDNSGDLIFIREVRTRYRDGRRRTYTNNIGFINIPDVTYAERSLKSALQYNRPGDANNTDLIL